MNAADVADLPMGVGPMLAEIGHDLPAGDVKFVAMYCALAYPHAAREALDEMHRLRRCALLGIEAFPGMAA